MSDQNPNPDSNPNPANPPANPAGNPPAANGKWFESLSEDFKNNPTVTKYGTLDEFVKGHLELSQLLGREKLPLPKDEKDLSGWNQVWDSLGRPKTFEDYQVAKDLELPPELEVDENRLKEVKKLAYDQGFNQKQFDWMYRTYVGMLNDQYNTYFEGQKKSVEEGVRTLRSKFGAAYEAKVGLAQKVLKLAAGDKFEALAAKYGNDPDLIIALSEIGAKFSEGNLGGITYRGLTMTPDEAKAEYEKMMSEAASNPKHPLNNDLDPMHKQMVEKKDELYRQAHPEYAEATT